MVYFFNTLNNIPNIGIVEPLLSIFLDREIKRNIGNDSPRRRPEDNDSTSEINSGMAM